jgi:hypothetical protein
MRTVLIKWLQHINALTAWFFLKRQAGMFADDRIEGRVLAFLDLEFNGDGDFWHGVSSLTERCAPPCCEEIAASANQWRSPSIILRHFGR